MNPVLTRETAYVESWGVAPSEEEVRSIRVGGLGEKSFGKLLQARIISTEGGVVLDVLTWQIDANVSPDLELAIPLHPDDLGAVIIAIE